MQKRQNSWMLVASMEYQYLYRYKRKCVIKSNGFFKLSPFSTRLDSIIRNDRKNIDHFPDVYKNISLVKLFFCYFYFFFLSFFLSFCLPSDLLSVIFPSFILTYLFSFFLFFFLFSFFNFFLSFFLSFFLFLSLSIGEVCYKAVITATMYPLNFSNHNYPSHFLETVCCFTHIQTLKYFLGLKKKDSWSSRTFNLQPCFFMVSNPFSHITILNYQLMDGHSTSSDFF